ncbi:endoplasmic oxidoreductin-1 [Tieghemiomyces parasiticus]|uniref:Endoplasmic oxidoreductin-1 n=1 Tax=Tieghemiomyces parasiticus TaxID=78921 RepID=A0A9W7ZXX0_9FUNG|nr:endoplasmic oxidoreductin-1 [Tieghemiomyces parasiticus]
MPPKANPVPTQTSQPSATPARPRTSIRSSQAVLVLVPLLAFVAAFAVPFLQQHWWEISTSVRRLWSPPVDDICRLRESGAIDDLRCEFHAIESVNDQLAGVLRQIAQASYFKYYKVDLYKDCAFWNSNGHCVLRDCAVETEDEGFQPFQKCDYADTDFCVAQDDDSTEGVFVDLQKNPERFTGYTGETANIIWRSIYEENCFDIPLQLRRLQNDAGDSCQQPAHRLHEVNECKEKRVFYRVISGLHASISTHLCQEYFNVTTQEWSPNLECFMSRVGRFPERLENIYFNYAILLRSVFKLQKYLTDSTYCIGNPEEERWLKAKVEELVSVCLTLPETFDEKQMFTGPDAIVLKEEFKDRFRNVSRIMDCVGCEKCRLWGKLQTRGVATALKILFSYDNTELPIGFELDRGEVVSLINTLNQFSKSLSAISSFHRMYHQQHHSLF